MNKKLEMSNNMERATIFLGRKGQEESYQLLIGQDYFSALYDGSIDRELFFDAVSEGFVEELLKHNREMALGTVNGLRIDTDTHKSERISKLEHELIAQLGHKIVTKYMQVRPAVPASMLN